MRSEDAKRESLRATFDRASDLYRHIPTRVPGPAVRSTRPGHQAEAGGWLLEVGCATGKATLPLARRGFRITCVEIGAALAASAHENLAAFDGVEVIADAFETWEAPSDPYDLVFAATAWHWIDPEVRYRKAAEVLTSGGQLAFWDAVHVVPMAVIRSSTRFRMSTTRSARVSPPDASRTRPGELDERRREIEESGLFDVVDVSHFDWETVYDADQYIDLLNTFSGHIEMEEWQPERLYGEIRRRLSQRGDGRLRRHWGGVLHIARCSL